MSKPVTRCPKGPHGFHLWATGKSWGIIIGVSRCKYCDELSRPEHFKLPVEGGE